MDPEGVAIDEGKWSLEGDDAAKFDLTGTTDNTRALEFVDKPDFEMPGDRNKDNIYEVTVVASNGEESDTRDVTVKITDSDEAGVITLTDIQGNRVLTEQDFEEVVVPPACLQALALDAHFQAGFPFQLVVGYLPQRRHVLGAVVFAHPALVFPEGDIQAPVQ